MYKYKVSENRLLTDSVRSLKLRFIDEGSPLLHEPGQYAAISLHDKDRPTTNRCFSIASSSLDHHELQFSIRVGGKFTSALKRLKTGDTVYVRGPYGAFVFNEFEHNDLVLLAGGIGVAPFMSMVRYATHNKLANKMHLIYSVRHEDDVPFLDELKTLDKSNPNLRVSYIVGKGSVSKLGYDNTYQGRLDSSLLPKLGLKLQSQTYMMCGPPPYMDAMQTLLEKHGVEKKRILSEAFSLNHGDQTGKLKSWPFSMYTLTGLSLLAAGFFIAANDLYKTIPRDSSVNKLLATPTTDVLPETGNLYNSVNSLPPQVDTNITQASTPASNSVKTVPNPVKTTPTPVKVTPTPVTVNPVPAPKTGPSGG